MPAYPDRIRIKAQIMTLLLIFQNICKFIKTAVIAVIISKQPLDAFKETADIKVVCRLCGMEPV